MCKEDEDGIAYDETGRPLTYYSDNTINPDLDSGDGANILQDNEGIWQIKVFCEGTYEDVTLESVIRWTLENKPELVDKVKADIYMNSRKTTKCGYYGSQPCGGCGHPIHRGEWSSCIELLHAPLDNTENLVCPWEEELQDEADIKEAQEALAEDGGVDAEKLFKELGLA